MAKRESSPGISPAKKRIRYRSGSNFNAEFTRTFDWVMASDRGKQQAYCKVCSKHFSVSHGGIDDVRRHGEGKKHLELYNTRKSSNQVTKYYVSSNSSSLDENVIKAETLISLAIAKHNVPLAFADHLAKVVKVAFPDSSIAKKYACGRGKTTQIIKRAIDPLQRAKVVEMCQNNKFSLMIDESNNHNCDKGLVILVRAAETSRVHTRFLDMPVVNVGSGENIFNAIDIVFRYIVLLF